MAHRSTWWLVALLIRCGVSILGSLANSAEGGPDDSRTFLLYFATNWVRETHVEDTWPISIAADRDNVAVIDTAEHLRCIARASGKTQWNIRLPSVMPTVPVLSPDSVLVLTRKTSWIDAYSLRDGRLSWSISLGPSPIVFHAQPFLIVGSNIIYAVTTNGALHALSPRWGGRLWSRELQVDDGVLPCVWHNRLFVATKHSCLLALDAHTGQTLWQHVLDSPIITEIVHDSEALYVVSRGCHLYKVSPDTGSVAWEVAVPRPQLPPIPIGRKVAIIGDVTAGTAACLVTVDSSTGRIAQRRICPRIATSRLFDGQRLWCTTAFNELHIIDVRTMCPDVVLRRLPAPLRIIGNGPAPLINVGNRLIAGGIDGDAVHHAKQYGFVSNGLDASRLLIIALLIAGVVIVFRLSFSGGNTIPPTHETTGLMVGMGILAATAIMFLILNAALIIGIVGHDRVTFARVVALVALGLPPLGLLSRWVAYGLRSRSGAKSATPREAIPADPAVWTAFAELKDRLGLRKRATLLTVAECGLSPYVFAAGLSRGVLVVPSDLNGMCMTACKNDSQLAGNLIRMILAHELGHLVAKDVLFLPLARVFRSMMLLSVFGQAIVAVVLVQYPDSVLHDIVSPALLLCSFVATLSVVITARFGFARESVADATATLAVSPRDVAQLISQNDGGVAPLEAFLYILATNPTAVDAPQRLTAAVHFATSARMLSSLRQRAYARGGAVSAGSSLVPRHVGTSFLVLLVASLSAGVVYQLWAGVFQAIVALSDIPKTLANTWVGYIFKDQWNVNASLLAGALSVAAPLCAALAGDVSLLFPLRDAFFQDVRAKPRAIAGLLGVIGLCAVLAEMASMLLGHFTGPSQFPTNQVSVSAFPCGVAVALVGIVMAASILVRWAAILRQPRRVLRQLLAVFGVMTVCAVIVFVMFTGISTMARIVLILGSVCTAAIASQLMRRVCTRSGHIPSEWLNYDRVLMSWRYTVDHPSVADAASRRALMSGLGIGCVDFAVLLLLTAFVAYPWLLSFDGWFDQHLPDLYDTLVQVNVLANSANPPAIGWLLWHYGVTVLLVGMTEVFSISASEAVLLGALAILGIMLLVDLAIQLVRQSPSPFTLVARVPLLERLAVMLERPLVPASLLAQYQTVMLSHLSGAEPYVQWPKPVPHMKATCEALSLIGGDMTNERRALTTDWVRRCAAPSGGYGCAPGAPANPLHTRVGLEVLMSIGTLSAQAKASHSGWVTCEIHALLMSPPSYPAAAFLAHMALLLESRRLVTPDSLSVEQQMCLAEEVTRRWSACAQTIEDTRNAVVLARSLDIDSAVLFERVRMNWLPSKEIDAVRLNPKTGLVDILHMVEIESIVYPEEFRARFCVDQIRATLTKAFAS